MLVKIDVTYMVAMSSAACVELDPEHSIQSMVLPGQLLLAYSDKSSITLSMLDQLAASTWCKLLLADRPATAVLHLSDHVQQTASRPDQS